MIKLLESELYIKCKKEDLNLIKGMQDEIQTEFKDIMQKETKEEYKCQLIIVDNEFLAPE